MTGASPQPRTATLAANGLQPVFTVWVCPSCGAVSGSHGRCRNAFAAHGRYARPLMVPTRVRKVESK